MDDMLIFHQDDTFPEDPPRDEMGAFAGEPRCQGQDAQKAPRSPARGLVVRIPRIGGTEHAA